MNLDRRALFGGGLALIAAPAIVKIEALMPVRGVPLYRSRNLLSIDMITREAVQLFVNSNDFIKNIHDEWEKDYAFAASDANNNWQWPKSTLRIRLPNDYKVVDTVNLVSKAPCSPGNRREKPNNQPKVLEMSAVHASP